jgi:hypothetical protein
MVETIAQIVMTGIAIWFPFGGLSRMDTDPGGGGIVGPSKLISARRKMGYDTYSIVAMEKGYGNKMVAELKETLGEEGKQVASISLVRRKRRFFDLDSA